MVPRMMPGVRFLLIALLVFSVGVGALGSWGDGALSSRLAEALVFRPRALFSGHVWKLFTYTLYEAQPLGLLVTGLILWMFASPLEKAWGTRRFLMFYFSTTALAGVAGALVGLAAPSVGRFANEGGTAALEALAAGFALSFASSQILLGFVLPIPARALIPLSLGITLLYVLMTGNVAGYVVPVLALFAGVWLHDLRTPGQLFLRLRVWWISRRLRSRKLSVVKNLPVDPRPRSGRRGSDQYLQ